jgi:hypothetical protein
MDQIIKTLAQNLGLPESSVRNGLGILLSFVKSQAKGTEVEKFLALLPGAAELPASPPPAAAGDPAGSLLGGLLSQAGAMLGTNLGGAAAALGALQQAGIPMDKAEPLARGFFEQANSVAGPDAVNAVLAQMPALQSLLGEKEN